jgi:hypothetical protein
VQYFKHSTYALAKLHSVQKHMQLPELQDVGTRWNLTLDMLLKFLHNKEPILSTLAVLQLQDEFLRMSGK